MSASSAPFGAYDEAQYPTTFEELFMLLEDEYEIIVFNARMTSWSPSLADTLADTISRNARLRVLDLSHNNLGSQGLEKLCAGLANNNTLAVLDLTRNLLDERGGIALARTLLRRNKSIESLYLEQNRMGPRAWQEIAAALAENAVVTELNCAENSIDDAQVAALARALRTNKGLTTLSLRENSFTDKGGQLLYDALEDNYTLSTLWIHPSNLSEDLEHRITAKVRENTDFQRQAFYSTLESGATGAWHRSRLMVVGEGRAGKTATIRSLLNLGFDPDCASTVGISLKEARAWHGRRWKGISASSLPTIDYLSGFAARITVGTMDAHRNSRRSVATPAKLRKRRKSKRESMDAARSVVSQESPRGGGLMRTGSNLSSSTSATTCEFDKKTLARARNEKDAITLSIWDYGGQSVFYTMHHLFLTRYGVYLLCFNMTSLLSKQHAGQAVETIQFWLNSVKMHAPTAPVMLAGTFLDQCSSNMDIERVHLALQEVVAEYPQVVGDETSRLNFFPLDNATRTGVPQLRSEIERLTRSLDFVNAPVSVRWIRCLESLLTPERPWLWLKQVTRRASVCGIKEEREVDDMLKLFHELGVVLHFTASEVLRRLVTTNPQWLVDAMSKVIRDDKIHTGRFDLEEIAVVGLKNDLRDLFVLGLASRDLLEYLWESTQVDYLLSLMRSLLLISDWKHGIQETYLVPSMIVKTPKEPAAAVGPELVVDFSSFFLPNGVFERLVCLCVTHSALKENSAEPILTTSHAKVWFGESMSIDMEKERERIRVWVTRDQDAPYCRDMVVSCMRKIRSDVMGTGLTYKILLREGPTSEFVSVQAAKENSSSKWFARSELTDESMSSVNINNLFGLLE